MDSIISYKKSTHNENKPPLPKPHKTVPERFLQTFLVFKVSFYLLFILVALQQHYAIGSFSQETNSVNFKINPAAHNSRITGGDIQKTLRNVMELNEKKVHKIPSGPSPVGNHRPPTRD